jgi:formylglycine-generating enzyme required for sulfatase activity
MLPRRATHFWACVIAAGLSVVMIGRLYAQGSTPQKDSAAPEYKNSLGMKMIRIPAGAFKMGSDRPTDPAALHQHPLFTDGDYDEKPVHDVRISHDFYISETEVTAEQFQKFRMEYQDMGRYSPYVSGMSWYDANAFCAWLSKQEKRHYRLPTEAEWEYAARAGSTTHFASGDAPPPDGQANRWGLRNMHSGVMEWTLDWYGPYGAEPQTDPVGPASGFARVVRGGGIMGPTGKGADGSVPYYRRSANRASVAPTFSGVHPIGFRLVEGELPATAPAAAPVTFPLSFVKSDAAPAANRPDAAKPWFRQRALLPIPPEDENADSIRAAGLDPALNGHNHSAGVTVAPNGDVLWMAFSSSSSSTEYLMNPGFVVSRLRFGSNQWDLPALFYDFADVNDQSALLWNDSATLRFFGGGVGLANVPFRMQSSRDNGATWSQVEFPLLRGPVGGYSPQPITSAFRTSDGKMYLAADGASDAGGGESLLWESGDNGVTWSDTGGRTAGRHTAFVVLKDGSILGLGGKNTNIDGYMPQAISHDRGRTWTVSKTVFPALGSNQRPTVVRLASGRIFFAGDYQNRNGKQPAGVTAKGAYVALSDDEGRTWKIKTLPGTLPHETWTLGNRPGWNERRHGEGTLGYTVATQAPNGVIHLITSMNHPSQHFEMNEAWILSGSTEQSRPAASSARTVPGEQHYAGGKLQAKWSASVDTARGYLLNGPETWFYPGGEKQYQVEWKDGVKTGTETLWSPAGKPVWQWEHHPGAVSVWTQYWPSGGKKHESSWRDGVCTGPATSWSPDGKVTGTFEFENGELKHSK